MSPPGSIFVENIRAKTHPCLSCSHTLAADVIGLRRRQLAAFLARLVAHKFWPQSLRDISGPRNFNKMRDWNPGIVAFVLVYILTRCAVRVASSAKPGRNAKHGASCWDSHSNKSKNPYSERMWVEICRETVDTTMRLPDHAFWPQLLFPNNRFCK